jgi:hypothetical protein
VGTCLPKVATIPRSAYNRGPSPARREKVPKADEGWAILRNRPASREALTLRRVKRLWLLLAIAAAARLLMQNAALPPYAGLDEAYHVARFAFVAQEGRNPRMDEKSIPPYVARSIDAQPGFAAAWPAPTGELSDRKLVSEDLRPYTAPNYQSQHPSLYYSLAAPLVRMRETQLDELRSLRLLSVFFAFVTVLATAFIGVRVAGSWGFVAAAILISMPTWHTLVVRASNDAFACAAIAIAFAISFAAPETRMGWIAEAIAWAIALAAKLYAWPAAVGVFVLWLVQRAPWKRRWTVMAAGAVAVIATLIDLGIRTPNPLGPLMFTPAHAAAGVPIRWIEVAKITIATFAWTSGPHLNALRPLAMALYLGPMLLLVGWFVGSLARGKSERTAGGSPAVPSRVVKENGRLAAGVTKPLAVPNQRTSELTTQRLLLVSLAAALAFALAQLANALAWARHASDGVPLGGKEGWYWYALAPLAFGVVVPLILRSVPRALAWFAVAWLIGWDVLITEGALFQDYAGITSAAHGDALFRWGGRALPFAYSLGHTAVGPLTGIVTELRVVELTAVALLLVAQRGADRP